MAKRKFDLIALLLGVVSIIVMLAIGGAFVGGMFIDILILKWLPLLVHQVVGWTVIVGAGLSLWNLITG